MTGYDGISVSYVMPGGALVHQAQKLFDLNLICEAEDAERTGLFIQQMSKDMRKKLQDKVCEGKTRREILIESNENSTHVVG